MRVCVDLHRKAEFLRTCEAWLPIVYHAIEAIAKPPQDWQYFVGILKSSPHFNDDPVAIQQNLRVR
jgi:hypothetical protein